MTYTQEITMVEGLKQTITTYDCMYHCEILDIFGMELTYHTLKYYTIVKDDYSQVKTMVNDNGNTYRFQVWLGTDIVLDEVYELNHSSDMLYKLIQYESVCDEESECNDEDTDDDDNEEVEVEE